MQRKFRILNLHTTFQKYILKDVLPFIYVFIDDDIVVNIEHSITLSDNTYVLLGMIYFGNFHFTSRVVDKNRGVWFHDGIKTGSKLEYEGNLQNIDMNMLQKTKDGRKCSIVIYGLNV